MRRKRAFRRATRTTISLPPVLVETADATMERRGFCTFSAYVQELIRKDAEIFNQRQSNGR